MNQQQNIKSRFIPMETIKFSQIEIIGTNILILPETIPGMGSNHFQVIEIQVNNYNCNSFKLLRSGWNNGFEFS